MALETASISGLSYITPASPCIKTLFRFYYTGCICDYQDRSQVIGIGVVARVAAALTLDNGRKAHR